MYSNTAAAYGNIDKFGCFFTLVVFILKTDLILLELGEFDDILYEA